MAYKISKKDIDDLTDRSVKNLFDEYREISGDCGWHQYLGSEKIGNIANAQALLILGYFNREFSNKNKVIDTLKKSQFKDSELKDYDGGWTYRTNHTSSPTTECTCWTLLALHPELDRDDETIVNGINWLLNNHLGGDKDVGWGCIQNDNSRTYATALALRTLKKYGKHQTREFQRGYSWLKNAKNSDGGWGDTETSQSTITHTAHAIITLIKCGLDKESSTIRNACTWLLNQYNNNDKWIGIQDGGLLELLEFNGNRISYYHYSLPWALIALMECNQINSPNFFLSFKELKENEEDGNWSHPFLADQKYHTIWSKHDSLYAIKKFSRTCPNWDNVKSISLKNNNVSFKYKGDSWFERTIKKIKFEQSDTSKNEKGGLSWWVIALVCGISATIIYVVLSQMPSWIDEFFIGFAVLVLVLLINPKRRFYKGFWSAMTILSSLILIPSLNLKAGDGNGFGETENFFIDLVVDSPHWSIYVILGVIAVVCLFLDYHERKSR